MAESSLSVSKTELDILIADQLGHGRTSANWSTTEQARIDEARDGGISRFYNEHDWSFLSPYTTLTLTVDDGTDDAPDDFGSLKDTFYYSANYPYRPLIVTSVGEIKNMISNSDSSGIVTHVAVDTKSQTGVSGSRYQFLWYPYPNTAWVLNYRYNVLRDALSSSYPYPAGGAIHRQTVVAACLAEAQRLYEDGEGHWEAVYQRELAKSKRNEARMRAKNLGYNRDRSDGQDSMILPIRQNTYNGSVGT